MREMMRDGPHLLELADKFACRRRYALARDQRIESVEVPRMGILNDEIDFVGRCAGSVQAIPDRLPYPGSLVSFAGHPLCVNKVEKNAVSHQARTGVVVSSIDAEDQHGCRSALERDGACF